MKALSKSKKLSQQNYKASGRRIESIGLTANKLRSKQSSDVAAENVRQTCSAFHWICPVSPDMSGLTGYIRKKYPICSAKQNKTPDLSGRGDRYVRSTRNFLKFNYFFSTLIL
jgi:hypothetical protein